MWLGNLSVGVTTAETQQPVTRGTGWASNGNYGQTSGTPNAWEILGCLDSRGEGYALIEPRESLPVPEP